MLVLLLASSNAFADSRPALSSSVPDAGTFSFENVIAKARAVAAQPWQDNRHELAKDWFNLSYDDYRKIRFRPEQALLRGSNRFEVQFFHPGFLYDRTVDFSMVEDGQARPIPYDASMFEFHLGDNTPPIGKEMGFAGFRLHYPLHSLNYKDEALVFLGASYFKMLGRRQKYGLSARGLSIDTALPKGEEFPYFREFWTVRPEQGVDSITVYALLDSPSVAGAYQFVFSPGTNSELSVRSVLFFRHKVDKVGISPLTSMMFYGEHTDRRADDFRPEVHNSDGLLLHTGAGEWLWRPIENRERLAVSQFYDENLRGFGLMQRDRDFADYQDLNARYHDRPSYWVEPQGNWGKGRVELVEIPTDSETNDNIVAYWAPQDSPEPGVPYELSYKMVSFLAEELSPGGKAIATRVGSVVRPGRPKGAAEGRLFVVDFVGGEFSYLNAQQPVAGLVSTTSGTVENIVVHKNDVSDGWRLTFDFHPDGEQPAEFRAFLRLGNDVLTETWDFLWTPR